MTFKTAFTWLIQQSAFKNRGVEHGTVILDRRRVFILPSQQGLAFGAVLLLMLVGSINYSLSLGFMLTFLLGGLAQVSMLHTNRNLSRLTVKLGKTGPVFAGQMACFQICLENPTRLDRFAIGLLLPGSEAVFGDLPAGAHVCLNALVPARQRGILRIGRFTLFTRFPLGLFRAWSKLNLDLYCLVYPQPETTPMPLPDASPESVGAHPEQSLGDDDFAGLRPYHLGDSPRRVAWKAVAREQGMLTKQFSGTSGAELWLEWHALPGMGTEARLSRLCRWVLDTHAAGVHFGLRLPTKTIAISQGEAHLHRCLEALARFGAEDNA